MREPIARSLPYGPNTSGYKESRYALTHFSFPVSNLSDLEFRRVSRLLSLNSLQESTSSAGSPRVESGTHGSERQRKR